MELFYITIGVIIGVAGTLFYKKRKVVSRKGVGKINKERSATKEERKNMIITEIQKSGTITNDVVEKMLSISNSSAENYLDELEQEGRIKQKGKTGRSVYYELP